MPASPSDIQNLIRLIQMDLTQIKARFASLTEMVSALNLPEPEKHPCSECGLEFSHAAQLREHLVNVHDWEQLELGEAASEEERRAHAARLREQFSSLGEPALAEPEPRLA